MPLEVVDSLGPRMKQVVEIGNYPTGRGNLEVYVEFPIVTNGDSVV